MHPHRGDNKVSVAGRDQVVLDSSLGKNVETGDSGIAKPFENYPPLR
jgi:hypothetical protein